MSKPRKIQGAFTSGELDPLFADRQELKYFTSGLAYMKNVAVHPQGGFSVRDGLRNVGEVNSAAARLTAFKASDGSAYDLVWSNLLVSIWDATSQTDTVVTPYTTAQIAEFNFAQLLDTMVLFHVDVQPRRLKHAASDDWSMDTAPFENIPTYDYGGPIGGGSYSNGVSEQWELEFIGFDRIAGEIEEDEIVFELTVNGETTESAVLDGVNGPPFDIRMDQSEDEISDMIEALPSIHTGITVAAASTVNDERTIRVTFDGDGNEGGGYEMSGNVHNKSDAAILCFRKITGVMPGEDVISADRGWPRCGVFYQQRLLVGGFKSLPNAWMYSIQADYYNFDERITVGTGAALIPMDSEGGETIERLVQARNLLIMTSAGEYWLSKRGIDKTEAPEHVPGSNNGIAPAVPVALNEGAALYVHEEAGVISEFRYTDVEGNFISIPVSLLSSHLFGDTSTITSIALRKAKKSRDANRLAVLNSDDSLMMGYLLREQEVTAFGRVMTSGSFKAVSVNGRNEMSVITERTVDGSPKRFLERFEPGLLLDGAIDISQASSKTITGLDDFEGEGVWAIVDNNVLGPYTVASNQITLEVDVTTATVGRWTAPEVRTLPFAQEVAQGIFLRKPVRIAGVKISLKDTTSIAVGVMKGGAPHNVKEINLEDWGLVAPTAELDTGFTGVIEVNGLTGSYEDFSLVITQLRPGRMTVRSIQLMTD